jgi:hypothetical protein
MNLKLNLMPDIRCFLGMLLPIFEKFENFCHIWTQKEKKRKGWDTILQILEIC